MKLVLTSLIISTIVIGNKYCSTSTCPACTYGYKFFPYSCLEYCPTGFKKNSSNCIELASQDLFVINFSSYRKFGSNSIESFYTTNNESFELQSKTTPIPTKDRGFYFFSITSLVSNDSMILAPTFCVSIVVRVFQPGVIFEVVDDSVVYFSISFDRLFKLEYFYTNGTHNLTQSFEFVDGSSWRSFVFLITQSQTSIHVQVPYFNSYLYGQEFRMDTDKAIFRIGSDQNSTFQGFISFFCMKNNRNCQYKLPNANICAVGQYELVENCYNCSDICLAKPICTRALCNHCYSSNCSSCTGYLLEDCKFDSNFSIDSFLFVKNCKQGQGFECFQCLAGFILSNGLCLSPPNDFKTITLSFDYFVQYQGGLFQSGANASTYSPFNNPESDDPKALNMRGYMFEYGDYMIAKNFTFNHSFTVTLWGYIVTLDIIYKNMFRLMKDGSVLLRLSNNENRLNVATKGECIFSSVWIFLAVVVDYKNSSTHVSTFCQNTFLKTESYSGYAFYDNPGPITITNYHGNYNLIYRMTFSQFAFYDLSEQMLICSVPGLSDCLGSLTYKTTKSPYFKNEILCDSRCVGCTTLGSCNQCKSIFCPVCDNFNNTCKEDFNYNPCFQDFHLSETNNSCCYKRCSLCTGNTAYSCSKCLTDYFLAGSFCTYNCPSKFTQIGKNCTAPASYSILMNITFNKFLNNFNDSYLNSFSAGSNESFYPDFDENDPIPSYSRGFYFKGNSFVSTSNFSIPYSYIITFWIRQTIPGILFKKSDLVLNSNVSLKYKNKTFNYKSLSNETWVFLSFRSYMNVENYVLTISHTQTTLNSGMLFLDYIFDDPLSTITIGSEDEGFKGFIWNIVIAYIDKQPIFPKICSESITTDCLWNCSFGEFFSDNSCKSCKNNCTFGCTRGTDCNLCLDPICQKCNFFNTSCSKCLPNSGKNSSDSLCKCNQRLYWNITEAKCLPCKDYCSNCTSFEVCITCNKDFEFNGKQCICRSGFYLDNQICLNCDKYCLSCDGPLSTNCTSCSTLKYLQNGSCVCNDRLYLSGLSCLNCSKNCFKCENGQKCIICENNLIVVDGKCTCPDHSYLSLDICKTCHSECFNCSGPSSTECLSCYSNASLSNKNSCICDPLFYTKDFKCHFCDPKQHLKVVNNNCECNINYYLNGSQCEECHSTCETCSGPSIQSCLSCKQGLNLTGNLCLCEKTKYWNGSSCSSCDASPHLKANKYNCICEDGFFLNNSYCEPCDSQCLTCLGSGNFCLTCDERFSHLNESQCFCNRGLYRNGTACLPCHSICENCSGPLLEDCLCLQEGSLKNCTCPSGEFWFGTCRSCTSSCLNCLSELYFDCKECETFDLNGICFDECPRGFSAENKTCVKENLRSLSFQFDSQYLIKEKVSRSEAILMQNDSKDDPFIIANRGLYFPNNSNGIKLESSPYPLVSPNFYISIWFKVQVGGQIFSINSSESFGFNLTIFNSFFFDLTLDSQKTSLEFQPTFNKSVWNHALISLNFNVSHTLSLKLKTKRIESDLVYLPYKDSSGSVLILGGLSQSFSGFIYSFEIFTSEPDDSEYIKAKCLNTDYLGDCLSECNYDEFDDNKTCKPCDPECLYGCLNETLCADCSRDTCEVCNNLNPEICYKCKKSFVLKDHKCKCEKNKYFDENFLECFDCPSLCTSCKTDKECLTCVKNSYIETKGCQCNYGYGEKNRNCLQLFFNAYFTIEFSNDFKIMFDERLKNPLSNKFMSIQLNSLAAEFELKMKNQSEYSFRILIPEHLKYTKKRLVEIELSENLTSYSGAMLNTRVFIFHLFDEILINPSESLTTIKESGITVTNTASYSVLASGAILMNPSLVFNLLNLVEMFYYVLLFDLKFHSSFIEYMMHLKKSIKFPTLNIPVKSDNKTLPARFYLHGIDSSLLIVNSGYMIILLGFITFLTIISIIGSLSSFEFMKKICLKVKNNLYFRWFYRFCIQGCFDLTFFSFLSIFYSSLDSFLNIFDFVCCFVILIFVTFCIIINIYILYSIKYPARKEEALKQYPNFYNMIEEFNSDSWNNCLYYLIFMMRRIVLSGLIIFCNGIIQLMFGISFCLMTFLYLALVKPFKDAKENYTLLFNESLLLIFYFYLILREVNLFRASMEQSAIFCIRIIMVTLGFNTLINLLKLLLSFFNKIRSKCKKTASVTAITNEITYVQKLDSKL